MAIKAIFLINLSFIKIIIANIKAKVAPSPPYITKLLINTFASRFPFNILF